MTANPTRFDNLRERGSVPPERKPKPKPKPSDEAEDGGPTPPPRAHAGIA